MAFLGSVACRFSLNVFPLTPALSPEERENGIQPHQCRARSTRRTLADFLPSRETSHRFRATTEEKKSVAFLNPWEIPVVHGLRARTSLSRSSLPLGEGRGEEKVA